MNSFILRRIRNIRLLFSHKYKISGISNRNISLLCNNCVGAMVLHDFGLRFNSPTVNLYLTPPDYLRFLCDLENNLTSDIKDISGKSSYPIGLLGGSIRIHFLHYANFEEAKEAWNRRVRRIDFSNLYVSMVAFGNVTEEMIAQFDKLPFKNKVVFVNKPMPAYQSAFYIRGFEKCSGVDRMAEFQSLFAKRYYDQFNWKRFLGL